MEHLKATIINGYNKNMNFNEIIKNTRNWPGIKNLDLAKVVIL